MQSVHCVRSPRPNALRVICHVAGLVHTAGSKQKPYVMKHALKNVVRGLTRKLTVPAYPLPPPYDGPRRKGYTGPAVRHWEKGKKKMIQ